MLDIEMQDHAAWVGIRAEDPEIDGFVKQLRPEAEQEDQMHQNEARKTRDVMTWSAVYTQGRWERVLGMAHGSDALDPKHLRGCQTPNPMEVPSRQFPDSRLTRRNAAYGESPGLPRPTTPRLKRGER